MDWQAFWAKTSDPMHYSSSDDFLARYAAELRLVIGPEPVQTVVEVGCGNGDLYERLGFHQTAYRGFDFSPAMVAAFRARFPQADVAEAALQDVQPAGPVDLVFSSGVIQYVSAGDLAAHLKRFRPALTPHGRIVHTSVPWRRVRRAFHSRELFDLPGTASLKLRLRTAAILAGAKADPIGNWFEFSQLRAIGADAGFDCRIFGSPVYPYRCHVSYSVAKGT